MDNETYESQSHWGMFRVINDAEMDKMYHEYLATRNKHGFTPLSAYAERIDSIPIVDAGYLS
jgi:hypothetical protein